MKRQDTKEISISFSELELRKLILQHVAKTYPDVLNLDVNISVGSICLIDRVSTDYDKFCSITSKTTEVIS